MGDVENEMFEIEMKVNPAIPAIPILKSSRVAKSFRLDFIDSIVEVPLNLDYQFLMPAALYCQLACLKKEPLLLSEDEFRKMWCFLIFVRAQDVYEQYQNTRIQRHIDVDLSEVLVPAPLGDLLYSFGVGKCTQTGQPYIANPSHCNSYWCKVDEALMDKWKRTMKSLEKLYTMRTYPSPNNYYGRSIFFCSRKIEDNNVSVRSSQKAVLMSDVFVRAVNDEFFHIVPFKFEKCKLNFCIRQNITLLRGSYIGSYVLGNEGC